MKTVQLIGTSYKNVRRTPALTDGVERWCANDPKVYMQIGFKPALKTWTRWFNVHSPEHIAARHPHFNQWAKKQDGTRPIYTRDAMGLPGNVVFPGPMLQDHFRLSSGEVERFFTHQAVWLVALAMWEGFQRIELCGFTFGHGAMTDRKYEFERPAIHYWIGRARERGIDVVLPPEAQLCHADYLYGYEGPPL